jgi:hypothetical protein
VTPLLALDVRRFPDAAVLAAVAEPTVGTTLVTGEGRALTGVTMWVRNRAQAFLRVALPQGAAMLSVGIAGASVRMDVTRADRRTGSSGRSSSTKRQS